MDQPIMREPQAITADTTMLGAYLPVPGFGVLPVNAFVIKAEQPVLIDTGMAPVGDAFLSALETVIDPADLQWIWLTHADADHTGSLSTLLARAPQAKVITTFIGLAKLGLQGFQVGNFHLLNPGQTLDLGDRTLGALTPATYDAPETTSLFDHRSRILFSSDSFGALLPGVAETAADVSSADLEQGQVAWATIDAPWIHGTDAAALDRVLKGVDDLNADWILSSHLPPARGLNRVMMDHLRKARTAPAFMGPDQAALEQMMAA